MLTKISTVLMLFCLCLTGRAATAPIKAFPRLCDFLNYYVAHNSSHAISTFYVCAAKKTDSYSARIYFKEERTIFDYTEPKEDAPREIWAEMFRHQLKLDQDTVDNEADIQGSTYLITHRQWLDDMEICLREGARFEVSLTEAKKKFPVKRKV